MVVYDTLSIYIESQTTLRNKLITINNVIDMLWTKALAAAGNSDIQEYWLDDGQVKIKTVYRSELEILRSINVLQMQKNRIVNQLNGRISRHVDSKSLNNGR